MHQQIAARSQHVGRGVLTTMYASSSPCSQAVAKVVKNSICMNAATYQQDLHVVGCLMFPCHWTGALGEVEAGPGRCRLALCHQLAQLLSSQPPCSEPATMHVRAVGEHIDRHSYQATCVLGHQTGVLCEAVWQVGCLQDSSMKSSVKCCCMAVTGLTTAVTRLVSVRCRRCFLMSTRF